MEDSPGCHTAPQRENGSVKDLSERANWVVKYPISAYICMWVIVLPIAAREGNFIGMGYLLLCVPLMVWYHTRLGPVRTTLKERWVDRRDVIGGTGHLEMFARSFQFMLVGSPITLVLFADGKLIPMALYLPLCVAFLAMYVAISLLKTSAMDPEGVDLVRMTGLDPRYLVRRFGDRRSDLEIIALKGARSVLVADGIRIDLGRRSDGGSIMRVRSACDGPMLRCVLDVLDRIVENE